MTFVGRTREVGLLQAELDAAREGRPRVVVVEGPAGIGKTTTVERFIAGLDAVRVARASGDEFEIDVSFGVVDQLLRPPPPQPHESHVDAGGRLLDRFGELQADSAAVVLVDDAQWADDASLKALQFACRRLVDDALLVVLVIREDEAERVPEGLLKLAGGRTGVRLTIAPLVVAEMRELASGLGVDISLGAARRLHEHSGGSPLHARGLLREVPAQAWEESRGALPAPRGYAALVAARLRALPDTAVDLLEAASVLGVRAPLATAAGIAGVEDPFAALDETAADLVALEDGPDLRFVHPLVRAGIYQHLSPARRARLHTVAAAAVDDEGAALGHLVAASAGADPALAARLEAFAERCAGERRWSAAVSSLVAASRLSEGAEDRERRWLGAVEAAMYAGDGPRARRLADATQDFAPGPLLDSVLAYVAIGTGKRGEAELRLQRAWDAGGEPSLAARIAERMAFLEIIRVRPAAAVEWALRARALLPGSEAVRAQTAWLLALGAHWAERGTATPEEEIGGSILGSLQFADDALDAARDSLAPVTAGTVPAGSLVVAARALARHAQVEFAAGEWDDAAVLAERGLVLATESDEVAAQALALWAAVLVPAARGEFAAVDAHVSALKALPVVFAAHVAEARIGLAEAAAARGRHAEVLDALAPLVAAEPRGGIDDPGHLPWAHLHAGALVGLGRLEEAGAFLTAHERIATERGSRSMRARLGRVRGNWHALRDEHDAAEAAFRLAAETVPAAMPYERALIELAHGRFLRRAGKRRAAAERLAAARDTLAALGAVPTLERCVRELDACGLTPVKRGEAVDPTRLTPQERSVARLVASGLSNRELAAELLLSVKTVERHLTHIYRKAGVASRAELAELFRAGG